MAHFTDAKGREWTVSLDGPKIQAIRDRYNLNLADTTTPHVPWGRLKDDLPLTIAVATTLCEKQRTATSVTPDDFAEGMRGEPIDDAFWAIHQAALDFFPPAGRLIVYQVGRQFKALADNAMERAAALGDDRILQALVAEQNAQITQHFANLETLIQSTSATSSPESSESAPTT